MENKVRSFVKINFEDLDIAEEYFENSKQFNEFLIAVIYFYKGKNYQIKSKKVLKYFNVYMKTMKFIINSIEKGKEGAEKKAEIQRLREQTLEAPLEGILEPSLEGTLPANNKVVIINNKEEKEIENLDTHTSNNLEPKEEEKEKKKKDLGVKKEKEDLPPKEVSPLFLGYLKFAKEETPSLLKLNKPLTELELDKLIHIYGNENCKDIFRQMQNKPKVEGKYNSVYLTALTWLKRNHPDLSEENPFKKELNPDTNTNKLTFNINKGARY